MVKISSLFSPFIKQTILFPASHNPYSNPFSMAYFTKFSYPPWMVGTLKQMHPYYTHKLFTVLDWSETAMMWALGLYLEINLAAVPP